MIRLPRSQMAKGAKRQRFQDVAWAWMGGLDYLKVDGSGRRACIGKLCCQACVNTAKIFAAHRNQFGCSDDPPNVVKM